MHYTQAPRRFPWRVVIIALTAALLAVAVVVWLSSRGSGHPQAAPPTTTTSTTAALTGDAKTWTAIENEQAGTPGWTTSHPSLNSQMEGYLNTVSAQQGDTVTLFVTTTAPTWTAAAYRIGWYGGILARQVWQSGINPGLAQTGTSRDPSTNMVSTTWAPSLDVPLTPSFLPGDYLFKLTSSTGWDWYVPLTVRDDASHSPILIVNSVTTWQAYNLWGGYDLYSGAGRGGSQQSADRASVVTFDRPYRLGNGSGDFLGNEANFVEFAERSGYDVSYTTDVDIDKNPVLLQNHRVVVSLGHDEYYSLAMRTAMEDARDHGTNLVFLGANAVYRHIRLEASSLGPDRVEINYRVAAADPLNGENNADVTVQWRDPPNNRPESTLLGEMYQCNPVLTDFVVSEPDAWPFAGTNLAKNEHLKGLVGSEYDHYSTRDPQPAGSGVEAMANSPVTCRGRRSTSDFTYYVAPSGAGVIDVGTNLWVPKLFDLPQVTAITTNLMNEAERGPLGRIHAANPTPTAGVSGGSPPPPGEN